jgi:hypothetical protein
MHYLTLQKLAYSDRFAILARLGLVAQLVEQRIENPCVGGSIPPRATKDISSKTPTFTGWRFCFPDLGIGRAHSPTFVIISL